MKNKSSQDKKKNPSSNKKTSEEKHKSVKGNNEKHVASSCMNVHASSSSPIDKTYSKIQDLENTDKLLIQSPKFDVDAFQRWYKFYLNENNKDALQSMRIYIMKDTQKAMMENGYYFTSKQVKMALRNSEKEIFEKQLRMNKVYLYEEQDRVVGETINGDTTVSTSLTTSASSSSLSTLLNASSNQITSITVVKEDCISALIKLHEKGLNPCILNMASRNKGGGGYETGQPSQEETLFRVSNYIHSLLDPNDIYSKYALNVMDKPSSSVSHNHSHVNTFMGPKEFYPLSDFQVIYSPNVQLFRNGEDKFYEYLENGPLDISIIAAAAYIRPGTFTDKKTNQLRMTSKFEEGTKQKIRIILHAALDNGHDSIVLSAFGCGAYRCPSGHTAELFHQVIHQEFPNRFKEIVFAILDNDYTVKSSSESQKKQAESSSNGNSSSSSNYESFKKVFC
ncbi:hypothetical protein C9374_013530 [Naegleria lovaniensis]|uniref:Microbial-type PARG catalytic domain-containing protein n=1 Tax=Naegleria lovaniensis TaxID=51637 RepID=A0AA88GW56_NAELO|nr:uncharacterized protein C9374_013530 [Naegleria lovaniensis]KAG2392045.1 hypothetical protein C9374_013530 [Naegleria lovaniensis]